MEFELGAVLRRTFGALGRNLVVFFILAVVLAGLPQILVVWLASRMASVLVTADAATSFSATGTQISLAGLIFLVSIVTSYILQGALIKGAVADFNGRKATFGECVATGLKHFLPLFAIAILMSIAVALGTMLLIIPGIILLVMWAVAVPARVAENTGIFESFSRSGYLTRGHRWKIFGLLVIYALIAVAISMVINVVVAFVPGSAVLGLIVQLVISALTGMIGAVGVAALYFELRRAKEGIAASDILAVFD